ncbi:MFS transporter [Streptomyces sp. NPDC051098]|uniref:MFS transporter n=1 Tax=Streptomyces sp. NPDC051098 TaxID=3155411 RepID=UPI00341DF089
MTTHTADEHPGEESRRNRRWIILALTLIAQFMVTLDATIVTVALPSIQTDLGFANQLDLQWVINAYILFFGGFLLLGGRAGDLFGRQRLFLIGLALFTGASLVNGLASDSTMLVAGRGVQGFGAALVSPAVLSIIIVTFRGAAERVKALGFFTAVTASGSAAGMLFGGLLTDYASWRWIFLVNIPIGLVGILGAIRSIPNSKARAGSLRHMDLPGAISVTGGLTLLVTAIVNAHTWGWGSSRFVWMTVGGITLIAAFILIELRSSHPLVRLGIFAKRTISVGNAVMLTFTGGLFVMMFFPTLYLAENMQYSPIKIGLAYLPWPLAMMAAGGIAQKLLGKIGPRLLLVTGLLFVAVGLLTFVRLPVDGSYAADVLPGMLLTAAGAGLVFTPAFMVATTGVFAEESGLASGVINTSQQLGSALGLAAISSLAAGHTAHLLSGASRGASSAIQSSALVEGFQRGFAVASVVVIVSALIAAFGLRKTDFTQASSDSEAQEAEQSVPVVHAA